MKKSRVLFMSMLYVLPAIYAIFYWFYLHTVFSTETPAERLAVYQQVFPFIHITMYSKILGLILLSSVGVYHAAKTRAETTGQGIIRISILVTGAASIMMLVFSLM